MLQSLCNRQCERYGETSKISVFQFGIETWCSVELQPSEAGAGVSPPVNLWFVPFHDLVFMYYYTGFGLLHVMREITILEVSMTPRWKGPKDAQCEGRLVQAWQLKNWHFHTRARYDRND